jgi:hypothetical protein
MFFQTQNTLKATVANLKMLVAPNRPLSGCLGTWLGARFSRSHVN